MVWCVREHRWAPTVISLRASSPGVVNTESRSSFIGRWKSNSWKWNRRYWVCISTAKQWCRCQVPHGWFTMLQRQNRRWKRLPSLISTPAPLGLLISLADFSQGGSIKEHLNLNKYLWRYFLLDEKWWTWHNNQQSCIICVPKSSVEEKPSVYLSFIKIKGFTYKTVLTLSNESNIVYKVPVFQTFCQSRHYIFHTLDMCPCLQSNCFSNQKLIPKYHKGADIPRNILLSADSLLSLCILWGMFCSYWLKRFDRLTTITHQKLFICF